MNKYWTLGTLLLLTFFIIHGLNKIPIQDEKIIAAWSQVENQYQRRADLTPSLVATVKGYAKHESDTLKNVMESRNKAIEIKLTLKELNDPQMIKKFEVAQGNLANGISKLMYIAENYPDLKANKNFLVLQAQLEGTENRITVARMDYISAVQEYNTYIRTFPGMLWAKIRGAELKANFIATATDASKAPKIGL